MLFNWLYCVSIFLQQKIALPVLTNRGYLHDCVGLFGITLVDKYDSLNLSAF